MSDPLTAAPDAPSADARLAALSAWAAAALGTRDFAVTPASADASFRRYFRLTAAPAPRSRRGGAR